VLLKVLILYETVLLASLLARIALGVCTDRQLPDPGFLRTGCFFPWTQFNQFFNSTACLVSSPGSPRSRAAQAPPQQRTARAGVAAAQPKCVPDPTCIMSQQQQSKQQKTPKKHQHASPAAGQRSIESFFVSAATAAAVRGMQPHQLQQLQQLQQLMDAARNKQQQQQAQPGAHVNNSCQRRHSNTGKCGSSSSRRPGLRICSREQAATAEAAEAAEAGGSRQEEA
jgi:hypothetical protein